MWLDSGDLVLIADSGGVRDVYEADGTAVVPKAPLAVLVNRGTASASEVGAWSPCSLAVWALGRVQQRHRKTAGTCA